MEFVVNADFPGAKLNRLDIAIVLISGIYMNTMFWINNPDCFVLLEPKVILIIVNIIPI